MSLLERVERAGKAGDFDESAGYLEVVRGVKDALTRRLGFKGLVEITAGSDVEKARSELMVALLQIVNGSEYLEDVPVEKDQVIEDVLNDILGLGPLESLLNDDEVTEIMVNGTGSLYFERKGKLHRAEHVFEHDEQIRVVIDRIISPLGRRIDEQSPLVNARLKSGYRVNAVIPPVALDGPLLTIRKFSDRISTLDELVSLGSIPRWFAQLLSWAVKSRKNIAVVGGTGSGKTTLLNALSCEIDHGERIITIEDSAELKFKEHPHVVRLERRDASIEGMGEVTIRDLVINSLRMRPDRIVVGECRGAETIDMLQAMNTGHDGSLTTLHAGSAEEAIVRLVLMSRYGIDLPASVIEDQVATALDLIVMQTRMPDGTRIVTDLCAVSRDPNGGVRLDELIGFDEETKAWNVKTIPDFIGMLAVRKIATSEEVQRWKACLP